MPIVDKNPNDLQVFRGGAVQQNVFAKNAASCCGSTAPDHDRLPCVARFENGLSHTNPLGGVDRWTFGLGDQNEKASIVARINSLGTDAVISTLLVPTFAFVKGVSVVVLEAEAGLTFEVVTRNGLVIPADNVVSVEVASGDGCCPERTQGADDLSSVGALPAGVAAKYHFSRGEEFSLEADTIQLKVKTLPASGKVNGTFRISMAVAYEVMHRCEF